VSPPRVLRHTELCMRTGSWCCHPNELSAVIVQQMDRPTAAGQPTSFASSCAWCCTCPFRLLCADDANAYCRTALATSPVIDSDDFLDIGGLVWDEVKIANGLVYRRRATGDVLIGFVDMSDIELQANKVLFFFFSFFFSPSFFWCELRCSVLTWTWLLVVLCFFFFFFFFCALGFSFVFAFLVLRAGGRW
jgi:hypothetical protein